MSHSTSSCADRTETSSDGTQQIERLEASVSETIVGPRGKKGWVPRWTAVIKGTNETIDADILVATAPMPQTLKLLERGAVFEGMDKVGNLCGQEGRFVSL